MNDHIALLVEATEDMSAEEQLTFHQAFEGAILFFISRERWLQAIRIAKEVVETTNAPKPPLQTVNAYSPAFIKVLRKQTQFTEVAKGIKRRRKQLREIMKHGGSIGRIRIDKKKGDK